MLTTSTRAFAAVLLLSLSAAAAPSIRFIGQACKYKASSTATERPCEQRLGVDFTYVSDYGAKGDWNGSTGTDDTAAINRAITALPATGGTLIFTPGLNYKISTQLSIAKPQTHILGYGATVTQTGTLQRGLSITAAGVVVEGLRLFNTRGAIEWDPLASVSNNARGIYFDAGSDDGKAVNCTVQNFAWSQISVFHAARIELRGNDVIGIGAAGGLVANSNNNNGIEFFLEGVGYPGTRILGNSVRDLAQGIFVGFQQENIVIANNVIRNIIGQHCMYLNDLRNATITGNTCEDAGQNGIKLQISATTPAPPAGDGINISVTGNTILRPGAAGIIVLPGSAGLAPYFFGINISGNNVSDAGSTCIDADHLDAYNISNNVVRNCGTFGVLVRGESKNGRITNNYITGTQQTPIDVQMVSTSFTGLIDGNMIDQPCLSGTGTSDLRAVTYLSTGHWIYRNNVILSAGSCSFNIVSHSSALVKLGRNIFPASLNHSFPGTLEDEGTVFATCAAAGTVAPDIKSTYHLYVLATGATCTIAAPVNLDSTNFLAITMSNTSGGAVTTTWNAVYKMAAWTEATNGNQVTITFRRDSSAVKWREVSRTGIVPN